MALEQRYEVNSLKIVPKFPNFALRPYLKNHLNPSVNRNDDVYRNYDENRNVGSRRACQGISTPAYCDANSKEINRQVKNTIEITNSAANDEWCKLDCSSSAEFMKSTSLANSYPSGCNLSWSVNVFESKSESVNNSTNLSMSQHLPPLSNLQESASCSLNNQGNSSDYDSPILLSNESSECSDVLDVKVELNPTFCIPQSTNLDDVSWAYYLHETEFKSSYCRGYVKTIEELKFVLARFEESTKLSWGTRQSSSHPKSSTRLMWKSSYVPDDGVPFINIDNRATVRECQYGQRRSSTQRQSTVCSKKSRKCSSDDDRSSQDELDYCPATVIVKNVKRFPGFRVDLKQQGKNLRRARKNALSRLRKANRDEIAVDTRYYVQLPLPGAHKNHPKNTGDVEDSHFGAPHHSPNQDNAALSQGNSKVKRKWNSINSTKQQSQHVSENYVNRINNQQQFQETTYNANKVHVASYFADSHPLDRMMIIPESYDSHSISLERQQLVVDGAIISNDLDNTLNHVQWPVHRPYDSINLGQQPLQEIPNNSAVFDDMILYQCHESFKTSIDNLQDDTGSSENFLKVNHHEGNLSLLPNFGSDESFLPNNPDTTYSSVPGETDINNYNYNAMSFIRLSNMDQAIRCGAENCKRIQG
ncbi:uncharacterized protein TRIADDRAFT_54263 [Trichoplax adhaerens]|uniref:Uncharacterized protein n=1 Tax=Trichoplax adhaerens TaxID=10228 RepID=B3RRJ7_TRIAD|nr:hypothetical protein TRIADDRAFT_54263 [Trichoplax adhaerens]EDV26888.1 hypothetical protein TRIADDRAFT_54263 [Trichoplax adhaerens]|eukprot:XP_002110884.1 hypothetical protein TRIADDRAFT_54263 [Trichoplax adhaerens]